MKNIFKISFLAFTLFLLIGFFINSEPVWAASKNCMTKQQCDLYKAQNNVPTKFREGAGGCTSPQGLCIANLGEIKLNVPFPKKNSVSSIEEYIRLLFQFLVGASGVVAISMMVLGGYTYMTAAGNQARVSRAKEYITDALIGMVLVFGSYLFLKQINENLVNSAPLAVEVVNPQELSKSKFCKDPVLDKDDKPKPCGEITTEQSNGASCRSGYCEGDAVCLPVTIGGVNNLTAYKCYENNAESLQRACEEAPSDECNMINDAIKKVSPDKDGCVSTDDGCGYGILLKCEDSGHKEKYRQNCNVCGGYKIDDDEDFAVGSDVYYCKDKDKEVIGWHNDNLGSDTWGAICCTEEETKGSGDKPWGNVELWSANGDCDIKYDGGKISQDYCDD